MKINLEIRKDLLDLGIKDNTLNVFEANGESLALEMLKLYAGLKKDDPLETPESRQAIIDTFVKPNPTVEYIKEDKVLEPEIVDHSIENDEITEGRDSFGSYDEDLGAQLNYLDTLPPLELKNYIVDDMVEVDLDQISFGELKKEDVEFMTPDAVSEKIADYLDSWANEFKNITEEIEGDGYKENDTFPDNPTSVDIYNYNELYDYLPGYPSKLFSLTSEDRFNNNIQSDVRYVMDYVSNPTSSKGLNYEIGDQTFKELETASDNWHKNLHRVERILLVPPNEGDDTVSDIDTEETNEILIDYRQGGKGYYWANLNEHFSAQEQRRMSHCGRCMHTLYSFRSTLDATVTGIPNHEDVLDRTELFNDGKPAGHTVTRSHFTISMGNDGIIYQMKAANNEKVPVEFHKYVVDILMAKNLSVLGGTLSEIVGFGFEYDNGNDFTLAEMQDKTLVEKLYRARKNLFTEGPRNISDNEMEKFMEKFNLPYEGPVKKMAPKYNYWEKPKNYVMTEREKKEEEKRTKLREKWTLGLKDRNVSQNSFNRNDLWEGDEIAKEPVQKPWWEEEEGDEKTKMGWEKAEYVYVLDGGEEVKIPCKYDPFLNVFTDVDDDEFFSKVEKTDAKLVDEYVLYKNKKINDAKLEDVDFNSKG